MGNDKNGETLIHQEDGIFRRGDVAGHVDKEGNIRGPDGLMYKGEEIGYVDEDGQVHRRDGFLFKGEVVGQIRQDTAYDNDGFLLKGQEWGYVDEDGNIRQKDGFFFKGRVIGQMKGSNKAGALGYYVLRFDRLTDRLHGLENEVKEAQNKLAVLNRVQRMIADVPDYDALGDFESLLHSLKELEKEILLEADIRISKKEELCKEAEQICDSNKWRETHERIQELRDSWKDVGWTPGEKSQELWSRFNSAINGFYERQRAYFEQKKEERESNRKEKWGLCIEAEAVQYSSDWKGTAERIQELRGAWKRIGYAEKQDEEELRYKFDRACTTFFERRKDFFDKVNAERESNAREKEELCKDVEALAGYSDTREATQRTREAQEKWKSVGQVPRDRNDELWERFKDACNRVFENARCQRTARLEEILEHKKEQIADMEESIEHDEENIRHWEEVIENLHPGDTADEIEESMREKISSVEEKIDSKKERIAGLESDIEDIQSKLRD